MKSTQMFAILSVTGLLLANCADTSTKQPSDAPSISPELAMVDSSTLALQTDPICNMDITKHPVTAMAKFGGKQYDFCSVYCKEEFLKDPAKHLAAAEANATANSKAVAKFSNYKPKTNQS